MNNSFEEELGRKIREADDTPEIRSEFVENLVTRFKAIEIGKNAEQQLAGMKENEISDPGRIKRLAAEGIVGRLMQKRKPPVGATAEEMAVQLESNPTFSAAVPQTPSGVLRDIRSGAMVMRLSSPRPSAAERTRLVPENPAAGKNNPDVPVK